MRGADKPRFRPGSPTSIRPRAILPPLWREVPAAARLLLGTAGPTAAAVPGDGQPAMLIPGLMAGDRSLRRLALFLRASGYATHKPGILCNIDCSAAAVARLGERVAVVAERHERRVVLVGHSRGGLLARALAVRRPDLVSGIVTLGSPHRDQLAIHPALWASAFTLAALGSLGITGVVSYACGTVGCCREFRRDLTAPMPAGVEFLSIYSQRDGVVDWRACLDPAARHLEVTASHLAMIEDPRTYQAIASALTGFAERETQRRCAGSARREPDLLRAA